MRVTGLQYAPTVGQYRAAHSYDSTGHRVASARQIAKPTSSKLRLPRIGFSGTCETTLSTFASEASGGRLVISAQAGSTIAPSQYRRRWDATVIAA
eukprot:1889264-Rhodomonas_salina.2